MDLLFLKISWMHVEINIATCTVFWWCTHTHRKQPLFAYCLMYLRNGPQFHCQSAAISWLIMSFGDQSFVELMRQTHRPFSPASREHNPTSPSLQLDLCCQMKPKSPPPSSSSSSFFLFPFQAWPRDCLRNTVQKKNSVIPTPPCGFEDA